jgi:hypothetical protein
MPYLNCTSDVPERLRLAVRLGQVGAADLARRSGVSVHKVDCLVSGGAIQLRRTDAARGRAR